MMQFMLWHPYNHTEGVLQLMVEQRGLGSQGVHWSVHTQLLLAKQAQRGGHKR